VIWQTLNPADRRQPVANDSIPQYEWGLTSEPAPTQSCCRTDLIDGDIPVVQGTGAEDDENEQTEVAGRC